MTTTTKQITITLSDWAEIKAFFIAQICHWGNEGKFIDKSLASATDTLIQKRYPSAQITRNGLNQLVSLTFPNKQARHVSNYNFTELVADSMGTIPFTFTYTQTINIADSGVASMQKLQLIAQYIYSVMNAVEKNGKEYFILDDDAPEPIKDIIKRAHTVSMSDNWTHDKIHSIICDLKDTPESDWLTRLDETMENIVDIRVYELTEWVGDLGRWGWADECMKQKSYQSLSDLLQDAQKQELNNIANDLILGIKDLSERLDFYGANFNICGYMPDNNALFFDDLADAKQYLIDEINNDESITDEEKQSVIDVIEDNETNEQSYIVGGVCYFIFERSVEDCLACETY